MSFAVGAFSGGARGAGGAGGGGGGGSTKKPGGPSRSRQDPNTSHNEGKDGRGIEGFDVETPNTTNTPMATASLMFHALTSGIGAMGKDGPDKK